MVRPEYLGWARNAHIEGTVTVNGVVGTDGSVSTPRVGRSLDPFLDEKAIEAVRQWKFKPAVKDGQPMAVSASIEVTIRLM